MLHLDDEDALRRLCGNAVPADFKAEVETRTSMLHRLGGGGRLGLVALIDIARDFGIGPKEEAKAKDEVINWRLYPANGTVSVEANFGTAKEPIWLPGVYAGPVSHGSIAVRLRGDNVVRERKPSQVRFPVEEPETFPEVIAAHAAVDTGPELDDTDVYDPPEPEYKPESMAFKAKEPDKPAPSQEPTPPAPIVIENVVDDDDGSDEPPPEESYDWSARKGKCKVFISVDGDIIDGIFAGTSQDSEGALLVMTDQGDFRPSLVIYAGELTS